MILVHHNGEYEIDDDAQRIDFALVHSWLSGAYWSEGISREKVERGAAHSALVVSAFSAVSGEQAGYMRVISDTTRFAYICDVFVDPAHRGKGLAKAMVRFATEHPDFAEVSRWILATRDAHEVYASVGFGPLPEPARWMIYLPEPYVSKETLTASASENRVS